MSSRHSKRRDIWSRLRHGQSPSRQLVACSAPALSCFGFWIANGSMGANTAMAEEIFSSLPRPRVAYSSPSLPRPRESESPAGNVEPSLAEVRHAGTCAERKTTALTGTPLPAKGPCMLLSSPSSSPRCRQPRQPQLGGVGHTCHKQPPMDARCPCKRAHAFCGQPTTEAKQLTQQPLQHGWHRSENCVAQWAV